MVISGAATTGNESYKSCKEILSKAHVAGEANAVSALMMSLDETLFR